MCDIDVRSSDWKCLHGGGCAHVSGLALADVDERLITRIRVQTAYGRVCKQLFVILFVMRGACARVKRRTFAAACER